MRAARIPAKTITQPPLKLLPSQMNSGLFTMQLVFRVSTAEYIDMRAKNQSDAFCAAAAQYLLIAGHDDLCPKPKCSSRCLSSCDAGFAHRLKRRELESRQEGPWARGAAGCLGTGL